jgi:hypothetical protein
MKASSGFMAPREDWLRAKRIGKAMPRVAKRIAITIIPKKN